MPVLVHTLYDFVTLFGTWVIAKKEMNEVITLAEKKMWMMPYEDPQRFDEICREVE